MGSPRVKVKAQVLLIYNDKTGQHIYRLIGGRVEFGELSEKAAIREFFEETHIQVQNPQYIGSFESLYILHGKQKHEIVRVYQCEFVDPTFAEKQRIKLFEEGEILNDAEWVERKYLSQKSTPFYPEQLKNILLEKASI